MIGPYNTGRELVNRKMLFFLAYALSGVSAAEMG
jgi:hypothetical protein